MSETERAAIATGFTREDFHRLPDDGYRYEILRGFLVREPAPVPYHQSLVGRLYATIWTRLAPEERDGLFMSPVGVVLADDTVVEPDLLFIRRDRLGIVHDDAIVGAPDLVVEVLSPSTRRRDLEVKPRLYAELGVSEYWTVDPDGRTLTRHRRPMDGAYRDAATMGQEDVLHSEATGWSLPLRDILR